jgi:hypothetical protein
MSNAKRFMVRVLLEKLGFSKSQRAGPGTGAGLGIRQVGCLTAVRQLLTASRFRERAQGEFRAYTSISSVYTANPVAKFSKNQRKTPFFSRISIE